MKDNEELLYLYVKEYHRLVDDRFRKNKMSAFVLILVNLATIMIADGSFGFLAIMPALVSIIVSLFVFYPAKTAHFATADEVVNVINEIEDQEARREWIRDQLIGTYKDVSSFNDKVADVKVKVYNIAFWFTIASVVLLGVALILGGIA